MLLGLIPNSLLMTLFSCRLAITRGSVVIKWCPRTWTPVTLAGATPVARTGSVFRTAQQTTEARWGEADTPASASKVCEFRSFNWEYFIRNISHQFASFWSPIQDILERIERIGEERIFSRGFCAAQWNSCWLFQAIGRPLPTVSVSTSMSALKDFAEEVSARIARELSSVSALQVFMAPHQKNFLCHFNLDMSREKVHLA